MKHSRPSGATTAAKHRRIQRAQDARDRGNPNPKSRRPGKQAAGGVQAGARRQPDRLPAQHLPKPGSETALQLQPQFLAPDYKGSGKLSGSVALITGGDSGIGRAVAVLFAREGADVGIVYLDEHEDARRTQALVESEGRRCLAIAGDVKDSTFCKKAVERVVRRLGRLDVLVNNAAFEEHADSIADITDERLDETLRTNVNGYFNMARAALPRLQRGSSIINTGSMAGLKGSGHLLDYATTKGAIHAFTKSLAQNLIDKGIRVNAVAPGPVWTPLNPADRPAAAVAECARNSDMKCAAQPEEISPAYVFLAVPVCSGYITGSVGAI